MARARMFGKNNHGGITWKVRKGGQPFVCATRRIPIKLHDDILNGFRVMKRSRMFTDGRAAPCHNTSFFFFFFFFKTGVYNRRSACSACN